MIGGVVLLICCASLWLGWIAWWGRAFESWPAPKPIVVDVIGGNPRSFCHRSDIENVKNSLGAVAVIRYVDCAGEFSQDKDCYVVFVHAVDAKNSLSNRAFQYTPDRLPPPKVRWTSSKRLEIIVSGKPLDIVVKRPRVQGVSIAYRSSA